MKKDYNKVPFGEIPKSWEVRKIGEFVTDVKNGAALRPSDFVDKKGFNVIPKKSISKGGRLTISRIKPTLCSYEFAESNMTHVVTSEYIITSLRDLVPSGPNIGYMVKYEDEIKYILAQGVYGFKVNPKIDKNYLIQLSNTEFFRKVMQTIMVGSTQVHIRNNDYFDVRIPYPPLPEQTKIADILSTVDEKIEAIDQRIAQTQELKKGLMQRLLTKGIGHTRFKDSPLGEIPENWEIVKLKEVTEKIGDGIHATPKYVDSSDYFFVNGNNLINGKVIVNEKTKCVSKDEYEAHKISLNNNTILMSINGTIGNIAYYRGERVIFGKSAAFFICDNRLHHKYLYYLLQTALIKKFYENELTGSTIKNLSLKSLRLTPAPLPSLNEQCKIADILSSVDEKLEVLQDKKKEYLHLKKGLMQQLLTGKMRVKVEEQQS